MILLDCVSPVRLDVTVASLTSHSALQTEARYEVGVAEVPAQVASAGIR
jgi:hypothetical protein